MTDIKDYYEHENYDYASATPVGVKPNDLTQEQTTRLMESKHFCILPWIHMHAWPNGNAYPCCGSNERFPLGSLKDSSMEDIWNSPGMKGMRTNMLNELPCRECNKCYEHERNGIFSMRQSSNKHFGHYISLVDETNKDGSLDDFHIRYWDIRFSNICNFKCRICGPHFSSNWYDDNIALYGKDSVQHKKIIYAGKSKDDIWDQMQQHIPYLEQIYFAGGEPLLMDEHYRLLKYLVDNGMTKVRLNYNTNFSELRYKKLDVLDLWKKFDSVSIGASLDGMGERAEYMRKGTIWSDIEDNRKRMLDVCPYVDFYISATVNIFNALHITDFHMDWADRGLIEPKDLSINVLHGPNYYRADVLPPPLRLKAIKKYNEAIEWLDGFDPLNRATSGYQGLISLLENNDNSHLIPQFMEVTNLIDRHRKETFDVVFPELSMLRSYATT